MNLIDPKIADFRESVLASKAAGRLARARLPFWKKLEIADQLREACASFDFARKQRNPLSARKD